MKHKISIVIPTAGREMELKRCIGAIKKNVGYNNNDVEIIIIDDSNCESIMKYCQSSGYRYIGHLMRTGQVVSKNEGLYYSTGEFVVFVDDDCIPDKTWLTEIIKPMIATTTIMMVGGKVIDNSPKTYNFAKAIFYPFTRTEFFKTGNIYLFGLTSARFGKSDDCFVKWVPAGNMAVRKSFININKIHFDTRLIGSMRYEEQLFCIQINQKNAIYYNSNAVCIHKPSVLGRKSTNILEYSNHYNEIIFHKQKHKATVNPQKLIIFQLIVYHFIDTIYLIFTLNFVGILGKIVGLVLH